MASCATETNVDKNEVSEETQYHALDLSNMDKSIRSQDDFFMYVNGSWVNKTEIPGDQGSWGSFNELRETNNKTVLEVLESASTSDKYAADSDQKKAANYYAVGLDSMAAENAGLTPLQPFFDKIDAITNTDELFSLM